MSRAAKWKIEKAKVKVVFRLQFHATNIPQSGWEKLFISFIPTETGKAIAKTSKANVRGGSCKWADPIYETTRLLIDSKTKQYDDKLYKLVVGMGTSRSSILGEATINLADYADASQPAILSLPLHGSDQGTLLHVTVQLLTAKTGFREFEQQRDKGLQSGNNVNKEIEHSAAKSPSSELQIPDDLVNKAKTRMQLREETNMHGEYSDSQVTCDESSNASDSYYADKHDSPPDKSSGSDQAKLDNDVAVVYEENYRLRTNLAAAESSISDLKQEVTALQSHANEMGIETQKFAQELTTEIASGQELVKEVNFLKSECSKLKNDLQNLKDIKLSSKVTERELEKIEHNKEVNGVLLVERQIRQIQEKILIGESDFSHLQSDLEVLLGTVQDLKNETFAEVPIQPLQELETAKAEKANVVKKMDQMECYYESLVQELEENQKRILGDCQNLKNEMNDLSSVNNELQKRVTASESALKRARLNYSIAVSQLQKDLDMLSFQVLSMFETNQTVIKEAFADISQPSSNHLSSDLKQSLSLQENIYKKVEEELGEMCSANLQLNVYSKTLEGTLSEASEHIAKMNEKLQELGIRLQNSNQSRDSLFQENGYYLAKYNDLQLQNQMLESDLGNLSNENFLLMEKITECEALLMDYRVYKGKYEVVSTEKMELEKLLEVEAFDKQNLQKEIKTLRSEMDDVKMKFKNELYQTVSKMEFQKPSFEKLQLQIDSVAHMFQSSLESGERHVQNSEVMLENLSSMELELQKISSEDKSFHEQIISELKKENQDLMINVENKREALDRLQVCLDAERDTVACLTSELESQRSELESCKLKLDASLAHNAEILKSNDVLLETTLANVNNEHALEVHRLNDMLTKGKAEVEQFKELQLKLDDTESRLNGCLKNEAFYVEENRNLATELESLRLELQGYFAKNAELSESKTEHALEVSQLKEMLTKSKEDVARYIEENRNLVSEVESLRLEFQTSVSRNLEISESKTTHALEVSQLKEMLTKSNEEVACYVEENRNLATEFESLRLELQASVAEITEAKTKHALEASQLKDMLTKSKEEVAHYIEENRNLGLEIESLRSELHASVAKNAEIAESESEHALKIGQLNEMLTKSNEEVARYIEENKKLVTEIESLRSELKASVAKNDEMIESKNAHVLEVSQLQEILTKSNEEVARYVEENRYFVTKIETLKSELQACVAKNAEIAESENGHALKVGQLNEMLTKSKEEVARYTEENRTLETELESLRLELQDSVAKIAEISESKTEHALEVNQLKEMLTKSKAEVDYYIEENKSLETEVESFKLKLEDHIAHNAETKLPEVNYKNAVDEDDMLTFHEESKITLLVFKAKLEEQNDELIILQDQCNQLTNKLSEQKLKTEEFKNLSIYLKELKDSADVGHEKKEKDVEGPTESLRMAFIKEQYQTKIQELKQQLSVSKRHNEEMLFKLQDALDEVESRKRSEASQLRKIQELEAEGDSVNTDKPDYDRLQAELECAVLSLECCKEEKEKLVALLQEREDEKSKLADELSLIREQIAQKEENGSVNLQEIQGVTERGLEDEESPLVNDSKQLTVVNDQFRTQHLMSCMEQLDEELEKMKNDNSHLPLTNYDPSSQDLQRELAQLHQANEELASIYPNFVDFRGNGNSLERVLALEIELAEALRAKKKSSIQFQSSFLKQHSDEEAVFKSFRDINELIKDMLEIKGKYANVENELKEMHDRYSQLSLQFAEVEGERQKLMMTLKSVRSSRNLLRLNRSSVTALGDQI